MRWVNAAAKCTGAERWAEADACYGILITPTDGWGRPDFVASKIFPEPCSSEYKGNGGPCIPGDWK